MMRAALLACSTAAAVHINCTVAVPRRIRAGDRVAARVDVSVAGAAAESLVVELRSGGPVTFGPGAPGLDPPGDAGDDDVIYAVRGERRRRWLVRLGAAPRGRGRGRGRGGAGYTCSSKARKGSRAQASSARRL